MDGDSEHSYYKVTMFFPLFDNDDNPFDPDTWDWWRDEITKLLKEGFTEMGTVVGWWEGGTDQNRWIVAIIKGAEQLEAVRAFLGLARPKFRQKAMYLDWHNVEFELIT